jgi:hypothetical protein
VSALLDRIRELVSAGQYRVSGHAYEKLEKHDILPTVIMNRLKNAIVVENYPDANRGPTILVLVRDGDGSPIHAVWGIPKQVPDIAVMITAYRPDPALWTSDFLTRTKR